MHSLQSEHAPTHNIFGHYTPTFRNPAMQLRENSVHKIFLRQRQDLVHCAQVSQHVTTCHDLLEAQARNGDVTVTQQ